MAKINWKIETRKLSDLKLWDKNPRYITEEGYEKLKKRIQERGFHDVLKIDTNNIVLSGNQRLRALIELGFEEAEVKVPDRELTDKERKQIALESNSHDGTFDLDIIANEYDNEMLAELDIPELKLDKIFSDEEFEREKKQVKCPECGFEFEL